MVKIVLTILLSLFVPTARATPTSHEVRADQSAAVGLAIPENEISPIYAAVISGTRAPYYQYVEGTITVPELNLPENNDPSLGFLLVEAGIGLDGFDCGGSLRASLSMILNGNRVSYQLLYSFSDYLGGVVEEANISPGDQIRLKVSVGRDSISNDFDTGRGWIDIDNLTNGESYGRNLSSGQVLCLTTANWYLKRNGRSVEDLKPIPDFDRITWSNASATTIFEEKVNPRESYTLDLDDGFTLTKAEVTDDSVTFFYDGL